MVLRNSNECLAKASLSQRASSARGKEQSNQPVSAADVALKWPFYGAKMRAMTVVHTSLTKVFPHITLSVWSGRLLGIFSLALVIRMVFVLSLQDGFYFPDSVDYSAAATNLLATGGFGESYRRSPTYPLFLAGIYALFGQKIVAVRLVEALMGACLAVMIASVASRIVGERAAALAGLLWSIYPAGIFIAGLVYPTGLATLLLACVMLCIVTKAGEEAAPARVIGGGIFLGLAALTVPVALGTAGVITCWMAFWYRNRRFLLATLFLLGVVLPLTPWTLRNFTVYDQFVLVQPRLVERLPSIRHALKQGEGRASEDRMRAILTNTASYARRFAREFGYFWELVPHRVRMNQSVLREKKHAQDARILRDTVFGLSWTSLVSVVSTGPAFLFALIGVGALWLAKDCRQNLSLLCLTILSFAIGYSFFWGKMRYRIPIEPYILILGAYGLRQTWGGLARICTTRAA
jgi:4-amino-4-deoxy-L-arabinose transferase-like glycosyltransferase